MKTLTITTKAKATSLQVESLFKPINGKTLNAARFDMGKYRTDRSFIGREIEVTDDIHALFMESRHDSDGPYKALFCMIAK